MTRGLKRASTAVIALMSFSIAQIAEAQRTSTLRLGVAVNADTPVKAPSRDTTQAADTTAANPVLYGAVVGAGIGLLVGFIGALLISNRGGTGFNAPDHSEDDLVIVPLVGLCVVGGFIVGGVVGYSRR